MNMFFDDCVENSQQLRAFVKAYGGFVSIIQSPYEGEEGRWFEWDSGRTAGVKMQFGMRGWKFQIGTEDCPAPGVKKKWETERYSEFLNEIERIASQVLAMKRRVLEAEVREPITRAFTQAGFLGELKTMPSQYESFNIDATPWFQFYHGNVRITVGRRSSTIGLYWDGASVMVTEDAVEKGPNFALASSYEKLTEYLVTLRRKLP